MSTEFAALVGESYERAYTDMVGERGNREIGDRMGERIRHCKDVNKGYTSPNLICLNPKTHTPHFRSEYSSLPSWRRSWRTSGR